MGNMNAALLKQIQSQRSSSSSSDDESVIERISERINPSPHPTPQSRVDWIKRDLEPEIIGKISELATTAIEGFDTFKEMAHFLKAELDESISWGWNVVVGKKFSGLFVHRRGNLANFKIGSTYFLLFNARKVRHVHK